MCGRTRNGDRVTMRQRKGTVEQGVVLITIKGDGFNDPVSVEVHRESGGGVIENNIILHFATERMRTDCSHETFSELEILMKTNLLFAKDINQSQHLTALKKIMSQIN